MRIEDGTATALGARTTNDGVNFAVFSHHATTIELCLYAPDGQTETARLELPARTGDIWHGFVPGLEAGALYGLRAHGPFAPHDGHRFNPNKLLIDPYARALSGRVPSKNDLIYAYPLGHRDRDLAFDTRDSGPVMPKCVVEPDIRVDPLLRPRRAWSETIIYEAHVKGLTCRHPDVPETLRGTYEALAHPAILDHLKRIGITAVELMPVQGFIDDRFLLERGLANYWGYNSLTFFAPEQRYFGPAGADGLRQAIARLHEAGIEVILDVVYNHTAETNHLGPTLSFRGLDNAAYYRLPIGDRRHYINDTGTGNTVNVSHPFVTRLVLDSLRHWVESYGVDGFRFDLMTTLAREDQGFSPGSTFMTTLRQDPVMADVKLIAEPWDIGFGGYQLGSFPPGIAEWNDRFRDDVRRFWRRDAGSARAIAGRLLGSADVFERSSKPAWSSVNFVAAHDGFTAADIAAYAQKHNEANGEDNHDGHGENFSDNCGAEGPTDDPAILKRRARRVRNLIATALLSQGTPMLLAGDELGNTQGGNNNAYAQDNQTTWLDWGAADKSLIDFVSRLTKLRAENPILRQTRFLHGLGTPPDVSWYGTDGNIPDWNDPSLRALLVVIRTCTENPHLDPAAGAVLIAANAGTQSVRITMPKGSWQRALVTTRVYDPNFLPAESLAVFTGTPS